MPLVARVGNAARTSPVRRTGEIADGPFREARLPNAQARDAQARGARDDGRRARPDAGSTRGCGAQAAEAEAVPGAAHEGDGSLFSTVPPGSGTTTTTVPCRAVELDKHASYIGALSWGVSQPVPSGTQLSDAVVDLALATTVTVSSPASSPARKPRPCCSRRVRRRPSLRHRRAAQLTGHATTRR